MMSLLNHVSNMSSENHSCASDDCMQHTTHSPNLHYIMLCAGCIIFTLNVPAVITVFFTKVKSSNFVYLHILSLSLTDACVGLGYVFSAAVQISKQNPRNFWFCWCRLFVPLVMQSSSVLQVTVISIDRLLIFKSVAWKSITKNSSLLIKIVSGTFLIALTVQAIQFLTLTTSGTLVRCTCAGLFEGKLTGFALYCGIFGTSLLMVNVLCTCINIGILWKHKNMRQRVNTSTTLGFTKETRGMVTSSINSCLQVVLITPSCVNFLVSGISGEDIVQAVSLPLGALTSLCSACNPVVYSFRIPEMRNALQFMWRKLRG